MIASADVYIVNITESQICIGITAVSFVNRAMERKSKRKPHLSEPSTNQLLL